MAKVCMTVADGGGAATDGDRAAATNDGKRSRERENSDGDGLMMTTACSVGRGNRSNGVVLWWRGFRAVWGLRFGEKKEKGKKEERKKEERKKEKKERKKRKEKEKEKGRKEKEKEI